MKLSESLVEIDQPGLICFIEDCKRTRNPQTSANGFLSSCLLIDEHYVGMYFGRECDCLAFAHVQLLQKKAALRNHDFYPNRNLRGPFSDGLRCQGML